MSIMRYKLLGKSGVRVSELALGVMTFGEEWGWGADRDECRRIFDAYVNAGGNFIDTANKYTEGTSEKLVGEFVAADRERFVVATKYTLTMNPGDPNACGNSRKNMVQACEASLKRLGTDYIDLYWLHAWDYMTPVEEVMRALDDLIRAGKIIYAGISDTPAWRVSQANTIAELRGWTRFVALQVEYSLIQRTTERDLIPMAQAFDMAITPWAVVGGGMLTGKYSRKGDKYEATDSKRIQVMDKRLTEKNLAIADVVAKIAEEKQVSPAQVAINWVRQQSGLQIPIIGARTEKQMLDNLGCLEFTLNDDDLRRLNEVSAIELGFPHDFLKGPIRDRIIFGGTYDQIDPHRGEW